MDLNLLIADDDKDVAEFYTETLEPYCNNIHTASDGVEALKVLDTEGNINLALIDITMPNLNGFDLVKKISEEHSETLMVIITATPLNEKQLESLLKLGVLGFLFKPTSKEALINYVNGIKDLYKKKTV